MFERLDVDGNGKLDLYEVLALLLQQHGGLSCCAECQKTIFNKKLWACARCCSRYQEAVRQGDESIDPKLWVTLCDSCQAEGSGGPCGHPLVHVANQWTRSVDAWGCFYVSQSVIAQQQRNVPQKPGVIMMVAKTVAEVVVEGCKEGMKCVALGLLNAFFFYVLG